MGGWMRSTVVKCESKHRAFSRNYRSNGRAIYSNWKMRALLLPEWIFAHDNKSELIENMTTQRRRVKNSEMGNNDSSAFHLIFRPRSFTLFFARNARNNDSDSVPLYYFDTETTAPYSLNLIPNAHQWKSLCKFWAATFVFKVFQLNFHFWQPKTIPPTDAKRPKICVRAAQRLTVAIDSMRAHSFGSDEMLDTLWAMFTCVILVRIRKFPTDARSHTEKKKTTTAENLIVDQKPKRQIGFVSTQISIFNLTTE